LETYLYEFLVPYGFSFASTNDIIDSLISEPGKRFFSNSHVLIRDREYLIIREKESETDSLDKEYLINRSDSFVTEPIKLKLDIFERSPDFNFLEDNKIASLDYDKLTFPLVLKKWKKGDYFFPLGMENKKLLSDFFIDNKFSLFEKEDTWLLISDSKVVWVIGHRIDNRFKIDESTKKIFQITYSA